MSAIPGAIQGIRAGRAYVEIGGDDSELAKVLQASARRLQQFGAQIRGLGLQIAGAGAAIFTPLAIAGQKFAQHGEELARASLKTGIPVEQLSLLSYAAQQSGIDLDRLSMGFSRMSRTLSQAGNGSKEAVQALNQIGLKIQGLSKLSQENRIKAISDGISKIEDPAVRAASAIAIFGRNGADMLPFLELGSKGIDQLEKHGASLGQQWTTKAAAAARVFAMALRDMWDVGSRLGDVLGEVLTPVLGRLVNVITHFGISAMAWVREHKILFSTALLLGGALTVLGTGVVILGTVFSALGVVIGTVGAVFGALAITIGGIVVPLGVAIGALVHFSGVGADVGNSVIGSFKAIWDVIKFIFDNTNTLSDAWGAAMTEAGFAMLAGWYSIRDSIMDMWIGFKGFMNDVWNDIAIDIVSAAFRAGEGFILAWEKIMSIWRSIVRTTGTAIGEDFAAQQAGSDVFNRFARKAVTRETAEEFIREENPNATPDSVKKLSDDFFFQFSGQQFGGDGLKDRLKLLTDAAADRARQTAAGVNTQDADEDAASKERIANAKIEADAKEAILRDLQKKQHDANVSGTAEERAASERRTKDAKVELAKATAAYDEQLKKRQATSGKDSLTAQLAGLLNPLSGLNAPGSPKDEERDDLLGSLRHGEPDRGAFNVTSQGAFRQIFGADNEKSIKESSAETARNTAKMVADIWKIAGMRPRALK